MLGNVTFSELPSSTLQSSNKPFNGEICEIILYIKEFDVIDLSVLEAEEDIIMYINREESDIILRQSYA